MRLEFSIYRYNPDVDDAPRMQDYTLEADEGRDMMLLDALIQLKEKDRSLPATNFLMTTRLLSLMA